MSAITTIAVLGDKPLEAFVRAAFPDFEVIGATVASKVLKLMAEGSVGMLATRLRQAGKADTQALRSLARNAAQQGIPAVFVSPSSSAAFKTLGNTIAAPTIGVAYEVDEIRPVLDLLRQRADRAATPARGTAAKRPPAASDLDGHPLVAETTAFLRNPESGRLDCKRIAEFYGESLKKFADALGVSASAVSQTPDSKKYQDFLGCFERVARILPLLESKGAFSAWARTPNAELKGAAPLDLLWAGGAKAQKLVDVVEDVLVGQPD